MDIEGAELAALKGAADHAAALHALAWRSRCITRSTTGRRSPPSFALIDPYRFVVDHFFTHAEGQSALFAAP